MIFNEKKHIDIDIYLPLYELLKIILCENIIL